jgi:hypothetical protein
MCDELGDEQFMEDYVTSAGKTSLCDIDTRAGCSDKESAFVDKWSDKDSTAVEKELARLQGIKAGKMKPDAMKWTSQRAAVLTQLAKKTGSDNTEL